MIVSRININATGAPIPPLSKLVIKYNNTTTSILSNMVCIHQTFGFISATGYPSYFQANAIYPTASFDYASTGTSSFKLTANTANLVFTDVDFLVSGNVDVPDFGAYFTFTIDTVEIPDTPALPQDLPIEEITPIDDETKITFCNSPIFIRLPLNEGEESVKVSLFVWSGAISQAIPIANHTFNKSKVSNSDDYISFEISDLLRPYINPNFAYNRAAPPAITNMGVFWQAVLETNLGDKIFTFTRFCTLGNRWNYEQNEIRNNGVLPYGSLGFGNTSNKWYNPKIHNYFFQDFDFTQTLETATTANIVKYNTVTPPSSWLRCTQDPSLIVFINKLGLWETFTPHGKITVSTSVDRQNTKISHRDPSRVDNTYVHSELLNSIDVKQSHVINTGSLSEDMVQIVEELVYSPKIYLIKFLGDLELVTTVGITIDDTFITIDDTTITIDSVAITEEAIGFFKTHQQIPVIVTDEDFTRKTRLNDKIAIDYNVKLSETNNKILQIR